MSSLANAHIGAAGPAVAGRTQVVTFNVGHGCEGLDTTSVQIHLPSEVTTARGIPSAEFGEANVLVGESQLPESISWEKETIRPGDDAYYQLSVRIGVPNAPFSTLYFSVTQTCRDSEGAVTVVEWSARPGEEGDPAAALSILPARSPGWNRYTAPAEITNLSVFNDAEIVWVGDAAYSGNTVTTELIAAESGVTALTSIAAGAEIWVKY